LNGVDLDLLAVDDDGVLGGRNGVLVLADLAAEGALSGIVLQQVSQHLGAGQIVDGDDLVTLSVEHLTESQTANAAKTIDSNSYSHCIVPPKIFTLGIWINFTVSTVSLL